MYSIPLFDYARHRRALSIYARPVRVHSPAKRPTVGAEDATALVFRLECGQNAARIATWDINNW